MRQKVEDESLKEHVKPDSNLIYILISFIFMLQLKIIYRIFSKNLTKLISNFMFMEFFL